MSGHRDLHSFPTRRSSDLTLNPWKGLSCSPLRNPSITYRALKSSPSNAASIFGSNRSDKVWVAVGMEVLSPAFQADAVTALCLHVTHATHRSEERRVGKECR